MGSGEDTRWEELREGLPLGRRTFLLASGGVAAAAAGCADEDEGGEFDPVDADELEEYSGDDAGDEDDGAETPEESDDGEDGGTETPEEETETPDEESEPPEEDDDADEGTETPEESDDGGDEETETPDEETETPEGSDDGDEEGTETPDEETETPEGDDGSDEETETPEEETETPEEETETPEEETETPEDDDSGEEGGDDDGDEEDDGSEEEEDDDGGDGEQGIDPDHPAAAGIDGSPVIGPGPTSAPAAIIAFDDPSCPNCADFHQGAFQDLQSDAEAGTLSFVWRGVPSTEDWAESALLALWATYDRDRSTFWSLLSHLLAEQGSISEGTVLDEVESFLDGTGVDAEAVRSDAESGTHSGRIGTDVDAAVGAGIPGTPVFHLFRDGEHRTEIVGNQSYDVFSNALEL